ncbi:MAG: hypothetical protein LPL29_13380 [Alphaproteobacteria bacterium]|nr:hypothetical protein [Alphaproteobacteria bacterium]
MILVEDIPITTAEDCVFITDRFGEPLDDAPAVDAETFARIMEAFRFTDEYGFVVFRAGQIGILFEEEFLYLGCEDPDGEVYRVWQTIPGDPRGRPEFDYVIRQLRNRAIRRFGPGTYEGFEVYLTVGGHVFNNRIALRVFIPYSTAILHLASVVAGHIKSV